MLSTQNGEGKIYINFLALDSLMLAELMPKIKA